jgi:hypothetical protein
MQRTFESQPTHARAVLRRSRAAFAELTQRGTQAGDHSDQPWANKWQVGALPVLRRCSDIGLLRYCRSGEGVGGGMRPSPGPPLIS